MTMNPQSARTLVWTAVILLVLGLIVPSPAGSIFLFGLAALCALFPTAFARKGAQLGAAAALLVAVGLAVLAYPQYQQHMGAFTERGRLAR